MAFPRNIAVVPSTSTSSGSGGDSLDKKISEASKISSRISNAQLNPSQQLKLMESSHDLLGRKAWATLEQNEALEVEIMKRRANISGDKDRRSRSRTSHSHRRRTLDSQHQSRSPSPKRSRASSHSQARFSPALHNSTMETNLESLIEALSGKPEIKAIVDDICSLKSQVHDLESQLAASQLAARKSVTQNECLEENLKEANGKVKELERQLELAQDGMEEAKQLGASFTNQETIKTEVLSFNEEHIASVTQIYDAERSQMMQEQDDLENHLKNAIKTIDELETKLKEEKDRVLRRKQSLDQFQAAETKHFNKIGELNIALENSNQECKAKATQIASLEKELEQQKRINQNLSQAMETKLKTEKELTERIQYKEKKTNALQTILDSHKTSSKSESALKTENQKRFLEIKKLKVKLSEMDDGKKRTLKTLNEIKNNLSENKKELRSLQSDISSNILNNMNELRNLPSVQSHALQQLLERANQPSMRKIVTQESQLRQSKQELDEAYECMRKTKEDVAHFTSNIGNMVTENLMKAKTIQELRQEVSDLKEELQKTKEIQEKTQEPDSQTLGDETNEISSLQEVIRMLNNSQMEVKNQKQEMEQQLKDKETEISTMRKREQNRISNTAKMVKQEPVEYAGEGETTTAKSFSASDLAIAYAHQLDQLEQHNTTLARKSRKLENELWKYKRMSIND